MIIMNRGTSWKKSFRREEKDAENTLSMLFRFSWSEASNLPWGRVFFAPKLLNIEDMNLIREMRSESGISGRQIRQKRETLSAHKRLTHWGSDHGSCPPPEFQINIQFMSCPSRDQQTERQASWQASLWSDPYFILRKRFVLFNSDYSRIFVQHHHQQQERRSAIQRKESRSDGFNRLTWLPGWKPIMCRSVHSPRSSSPKGAISTLHWRRQRRVSSRVWKVRKNTRVVAAILYPDQWMHDRSFRRLLAALNTGMIAVICKNRNSSH